MTHWSAVALAVVQLAPTKGYGEVIAVEPSR